MIIKFDKFSLITENPDAIQSWRSTEPVRIRWSRPSNIAFGYFNDSSSNFEGKFLAEKGVKHSQLRYDRDRTVNHRSYLDYPGRVFTDEKIITFWIYPEPKKLKEIIAELETFMIEEIDDEWKIEVAIINGEIKKSTNEDWEETNDEAFEDPDNIWNDRYNVLYIPISQYEKFWNGIEKKSQGYDIPHFMTGDEKMKTLGYKPKFVKTPKGMSQAQYRNKATKFKYTEQMLTHFDDFAGGVISVKIDGTTMYFHLKYDEDSEPFEVKLYLHDGKYEDLSVIIPDSEELKHKEFFLNPKVNPKIVNTLVKENFIKESGKTSIAGDKQTKSYMIV